jgi:Glycosyltransferase like family 2
MTYGKKTLGSIGVMSGIPFCHTEFMISLAKMIQYNSEYVCQPGEVIHLVTSDISFHMTARNNLCRDMLGDWIFMMDMDHFFGPDLLARMVYALNSFRVDGEQVDVLTALYHYRTQPFNPVLYKFNSKEKLTTMVDWGNQKLIPVDAAGAGALMIRRSVLERIYEELKEEPFTITPPYSEDNSFFMRLRKLGIKAYCAPYIESYHLRTQALSRKDQQRTPDLWEGLEEEDIEILDAVSNPQ